jgi:Trk-type K+ transport system membrane component
MIDMLRGRDRGLPVAVDRAVLLPDEFVVHYGHDKYSDEKAITSNPSLPTPGN